MRLAWKIIRRVCRGLFRLVNGLGTGSSQALNYTVLHGSPYQTTSAHCHVNPRLHRMRDMIDFMAHPFEADHCAKAWARDVADARRTLEVNDALPARNLK